MMVNIQTPEGLKKVVADIGEEVRAKIRELEGIERRIMEMEATFDTPGLVTLCDIPGVKDSTGRALPSSEKDATMEGTMAYAIAQAGVIEQINFVPAHENITWFDTCFIRAGRHICMAAINLHIPNTVGEKPQSATEYRLCTLRGIRPARNVAVSAWAILNDNTTEINVTVLIKTTGEVAVIGRFSSAGLHISYIRCSGCFVLDNQD